MHWEQLVSAALSGGAGSAMVYSLTNNATAAIGAFFCIICAIDAIVTGCRP